MCGGRVFETDGRENVFVRGAGVERVLHTVRMESMAHAGASGMAVEGGRPLGRILGDFRCESGVGAWLRLLFSGVDFVGVLFCGRWRVGVGLVGVDCGAGECFGGVAGVCLARDGVPGAEALPERLVAAVFADRERSRKARSFLYAFGGQGGLPSSGGSFRVRLSLPRRLVSIHQSDVDTCNYTHLLQASSAHA